MQTLERLHATPAASWYAVRGDHAGPVERYVVSTAGGRAVTSRPDILGVAFNDALHSAVSDALATAPFRGFIESGDEERVTVVHFLRGGLNFEIRRALWTAYRFNRHSSAFMSSQRFREDGRWRVREDMYRKLEIPRDALLVMGDVVATGVTMENGLNVVIDHVHAQGSSLRGLVFFTIGCHKAEKVLTRLDARMRELWPGYERTVLVYLEGKFRLVDSRTPLRIGIPGTDLVRLDALVAPELALDQWGDPGAMLERCAIYDAGSRAFDIPTYAEDVLDYWRQVGELAREGWTLADAVTERLGDDPGRAREPAVAAGRWTGLDPALLAELADRRARFWADPAIRAPDSLARVVGRRLRAVARAAGHPVPEGADPTEEVNP